MLAGGLSAPFQRQPTMYGRRGFPASNATSTSSLTSGTNQLPRLFPPNIVASRAHASYFAPSVSGDQGSEIFTRPSPAGSVMSVTSAGKTPYQRPPKPYGIRSVTIVSIAVVSNILFFLVPGSKFQVPS